MSVTRSVNLDLLRIIGVLIIMMAHASPPEWLFQLRNFGTPLLIVASALTYSAIFVNRTPQIKPFYKKRLMRLVLPAWVFVSFFFVFFLALSYMLGVEYPFTIKQIIKTYLLYDGIGFVWIFKVYIILALITPLALKIMKLPVSNTLYYLVLCVLYLMYEVLLATTVPFLSGLLLKLLNNTVFIIIPYAILYAYGMRLSRLSDSQIVNVSLVFFLIFLIISIGKYMDLGFFVPTQQYKYPPTIYYLSYAIACLNFLYLLCRSLSEFNGVSRKIILWFSSNSLWVYLWHIMVFYLWDFSGIQFQNVYLSFILKATLMLSLGSILTVIQLHLVVKFAPENTKVGRLIRSTLS